MSKCKTAIFWFRRDLRLDDNPALRAAVDNNDVVIPVYLLDGAGSSPLNEGAASRVWLHHSLKSLAGDLETAGSRLILRAGCNLDTLRGLVEETGSTRVYWNRLYESQTIERDKELKQALIDSGVEVETHNGALLYEPWEVENKQGKPYKVYTPFWRELERRGRPAEPVSGLRKVAGPETWPESLSIDDLELLPQIPWHKGIEKAWQPGEKGAGERLREFLDGTVENYGDRRDFPAEPATSKLSPHLHFGEISPRTVFHETLARGNKVTPYLKQIVWREFAHHLLYHFPNTAEENLNSQFDAFPWRKSDEELRAWQRGRTGYPIVDAGMRELWHSGWMHNRVRMIVASFLVKDLMIHWREGARWFWDTLVDADLANNTLGWQWVAGSGADASPYFRVFNPVSQGEKFDGEGDYVRRWIPELADLPNKFIHKPWEAPAEVLEKAGVELGKDYPKPMVDHARAREDALEAYASIRNRR